MAAHTETSMHVPLTPFTWQVGGAPELALLLDDAPEEDALVLALVDALDAAELAVDVVELALDAAELALDAVVVDALDDPPVPGLPPVPPTPVVAGREDELDVAPAAPVPRVLVVPFGALASPVLVGAPPGAAEPLEPPAAGASPRRSGL
jgi:hypothetical protein